MDNGALTHVSHDLKSLSQAFEYEVTNSLIVGDYNKFKISHVDNLSICHEI